MNKSILNRYLVSQRHLWYSVTKLRTNVSVTIGTLIPTKCSGPKESRAKNTIRWRMRHPGLGALRVLFFDFCCYYSQCFFTFSPLTWVFKKTKQLGDFLCAIRSTFRHAWLLRSDHLCGIYAGYLCEYVTVWTTAPLLTPLATTCPCRSVTVFVKTLIE